MAVNFGVFVVLYELIKFFYDNAATAAINCKACQHLRSMLAAMEAFIPRLQRGAHRLSDQVAEDCVTAASVNGMLQLMGDAMRSAQETVRKYQARWLKCFKLRAGKVNQRIEMALQHLRDALMLFDTSLLMDIREQSFSHGADLLDLRLDLRRSMGASPRSGASAADLRGVQDKRANAQGFQTSNLAHRFSAPVYGYPAAAWVPPTRGSAASTSYDGGEASTSYQEASAPALARAIQQHSGSFLVSELEAAMRASLVLSHATPAPPPPPPPPTPPPPARRHARRHAPRQTEDRDDADPQLQAMLLASLRERPYR